VEHSIEGVSYRLSAVLDIIAVTIKIRSLEVEMEVLKVAQCADHGEIAGQLRSQIRSRSVYRGVWLKDIPEQPGQ
jgi:hypothetical protein